MALMVGWFDRVGYSVNLAELHKTFSDVDWQGYAQWAESQDWQFLTDNMVAYLNSGTTFAMKRKFLLNVVPPRELENQRKAALVGVFYRSKGEAQPSARPIDRREVTCTTIGTWRRWPLLSLCH